MAAVCLRGSAPSSRTAFPTLNKRNLSSERSLLITDSFISKYDQFRLLSFSEKIHRLTSRTLNVFIQSTSHQEHIEERWKKLQVHYMQQEGRELVDYDPHNLDENLKRLLLFDNGMTMKAEDLTASITTQKWARREDILEPLGEEPTIEQKFIGHLLPKYIRNKTALLGAGTWGGNETFYFLRTLGNYAEARSSIQYVANIEVNRLNARLANIVAQELDLNPERFKTIEGNALKGFPIIPPEIGAAQHAIICTRFLPILSSEEIFALTRQIHTSITRIPGYAILTYSTLSLRDWENPKSGILNIYLKEVRENKLRMEEIKGQNKELLGISFIALISDKKGDLVNGATSQNFLFREKINQFFADYKLKIIEQIDIGEQGFLRREAVVLTA